MEKTFEQKLKDALLTISTPGFLPVTGEITNNGVTLRTNDEIRKVLARLISIGATKEVPWQLLFLPGIANLLLFLAASMFEMGRAYEINERREQDANPEI